MRHSLRAPGHAPTERVDLSARRIGDQIAIGEALLRVTQIGKECHERCAIYYRAGDCVMPKEGVFAAVVKSGTIRVGEPVSVRPARRQASIRLQKALGKRYDYPANTRTA